VDRDPDFTDALAGQLFDLAPGRLTTGHVTTAITRAIVRWANDCGWKVRTEARVDVPTLGAVCQLGFVDVLIHRGGGQADIAIEIDSADKPWSVVKLQHAAAAGMHAIWVRWGDDEWAGVYEDVDVIQLREMRRPRHRPKSDQLTVWS
jgi:hypothetical protein